MQPPQQRRNLLPGIPEEDADAFLHQVKQRFTDQPNVFHQFLAALHEYHTQAITVHSMMLRVSELFRGHADLMQRLKVFFPATSITPTGFYHNGCDIAEEKAKLYLDLVKLHFRDHPEGFRQLLQVMHNFHTQTIDLASIMSRVSELLQGAPELLLGFNAFLPPEARIGPEWRIVSRY